MIDKRAVIDRSAEIADDVVVGPYAIIGPNVEIDSGTWVGPHAVIKQDTQIGRDNKIYQFASLGEDPQHLGYKGEKTYLRIGDRNLIREFCTINRGTKEDRGVTTIGDDNMFMSYVHIAHDCCVGNHTIFANNATLAGHVTVGDFSILGGFAAILQFCHLGAHSFISGGSLVVKDVLPFIKVAGNDIYAKPFGLNGVGLRRRGFSAEAITQLKKAYKIIYREGLTAARAIKKLEPSAKKHPEILLLIDALKNTKHGIIR